MEMNPKRKRNNQILKMREKGFSYRKIGKKLGIAAETARKLSMVHCDCCGDKVSGKINIVNTKWEKGLRVDWGCLYFLKARKFLKRVDKSQIPS